MIKEEKPLTQRKGNVGQSTCKHDAIIIPTTLLAWVHLPVYGV